MEKVSAESWEMCQNGSGCYFDLISSCRYPLAGADPGFFKRGARKNAENQGHISIELDMYKEYIAELRSKRATNFEARNVQTL